MQALQDKTTVITGGNSSIGLAIARRFASEGAYVFITGRHQGELDKAVAAIGANMEAVAGISLRRPVWSDSLRRCKPGAWGWISS